VPKYFEEDLVINTLKKYGKSIINIKEIPRKKINTKGMADGKEIEPGLIVVNRLKKKPKDLNSILFSILI
jgi:UTP-glucose-1-phosphate uridylyltransferase